MVEDEFDILIVGGGLIGAVLLLALAPSGFRCLLVDNRSLSLRLKDDFDARSFALSSASVRILNALNLWKILDKRATPIQHIHVSEQGRFGHARLSSEKDGNEPYGYVVESQDLNHVVYKQLDQDCLLTPATVSAFDVKLRQLTIDTATHQRKIRARLVIAADGADSCMRRFCQLNATEKNYSQHALVANIGLARSHQYTAYERFTKTGPMAFLPMREQRSALVWCLDPAESMRWQHAPEKDFLSMLQHQFGYRLGRFLKVGTRTSYPLRQVLINQPVYENVVFIGNAAHTLHPVAGQGFNLGLRDVAWLAQHIVQQKKLDMSLEDYQIGRQHDQMAISQFTDGLIELFTAQKVGLGLARSFGLSALDNSVCLKQILSHYARGYAGPPSDLICGMPLTGSNLEGE